MRLSFFRVYKVMDMLLLCHIEAYAYAVVVLAEVTNGGEGAIAAYRGKSLKEQIGRAHV